MGLVSKWADDETLVKKAISQEQNVSKKSTLKSNQATPVKPKQSSPIKKTVLESKWGPAVEEKSQIKSSPPKKHKEPNYKNRSKTDDQETSNNQLASRLGISQPKNTKSTERQPQTRRKHSSGKEIALANEVDKEEETSEESEEEVSKDLNDLSLGAQDLASRLGLIAKPTPTHSRSSKEKDVVKNKQRNNGRQTKNDVGLSASLQKIQRHDIKAEKQRASKKVADLTKVEKPTIDFNKMFDDFSQGKKVELDWADDDDEEGGWDISKFKV